MSGKRQGKEGQQGGIDCEGALWGIMDSFVILILWWWFHR